MSDVDQKISGFVNAKRKFHEKVVFEHLAKSCFSFKDLFPLKVNFCIAKVVDCTKCSRPAGTGVPAHLNPGCFPSNRLHILIAQFVKKRPEPDLTENCVQHLIANYMHLQKDSTLV